MQNSHISKIIQNSFISKLGSKTNIFCVLLKTPVIFVHFDAKLVNRLFSIEPTFALTSDQNRHFVSCDPVLGANARQFRTKRPQVKKIKIKSFKLTSGFCAKEPYFGMRPCCFQMLSKYTRNLLMQ